MKLNTLDTRRIVASMFGKTGFVMRNSSPLRKARFVLGQHDERGDVIMFGTGASWEQAFLDLLDNSIAVPLNEPQAGGEHGPG